MAFEFIQDLMTSSVMLSTPVYGAVLSALTVSTCLNVQTLTDLNDSGFRKPPTKPRVAAADAVG
eukprot:CAMPEP_0204331906 /NCGR_PEP_ID=MMETSP0469-20131031/16069_1 /ASSEMBLY_ACC=CAM_ASM_000384 /TAXON_ID=2969 /ORGANISM="Oxyrrhis marina" /LENGTH=63 /DNA_ID=CAMNT_0051314987 /DNA_START=162 /DNA_END=349 /DNA_ORIENTATION=-